MLKIKVLRKRGELAEMLRAWEEDNDAMEYGMFIEYIPGEQIAACDNRDGNAWCEDFDTVEEALEWFAEY